jgi:hypothetical protein
LKARIKVEAPELWGRLKAGVEDKDARRVTEVDIVANWYLELKSHLIAVCEENVDRKPRNFVNLRDKDRINFYNGRSYSPLRNEPNEFVHTFLISLICYGQNGNQATRFGGRHRLAPKRA